MSATKIILSLSLVFSSLYLQAQDYGLYWKYKDYDGSISLTVPRFLVDMGALFVEDKEDRNLLLKVHKARIMVFSEGQNPVTTKDLQRFDRVAKRRHLEELLNIRQGKTRVRVLAKERRNAIRKLVVLVSTPEDFAMVTLKGNLNWDQINRALGKYSKDLPLKGNSKSGKELMKIPVQRI